MKRSVKNFVKRTQRNLFVLGQRFGLNILPRHFYSNIPDIRYLEKNDFWLRPNSMTGIEMNSAEEQITLIKQCCSMEDAEQLPLKSIHKKAIEENAEDGGFGSVEAEFLNYFVKFFKPRKVVQVGCGVSTAVILNAAREANHTIQITCIEPYPSSFLRKKNESREILLIAQKAQELKTDLFTGLESGDLLFIDSTHTVKPGSEVNFLVFEILPRLKKGVYVHFHDIYFPFDYGRNILSKDLFFWLENSLLYAFLINNKKFKILICQSMLHYERSNELKTIFKGYDPQENFFGLAKGETSGKHFPASLYLEVMQ